MPKKIKTPNNLKTLIIFTLFFLVFFVTPLAASAINLNVDYPAIPYPGPGGTIDLNCIETGECTLTMGNILIYIYIVSIWIGGIIAVLTLFYVGFIFIYSGNNPGARARAKKRFQDVLIGLAILFTAVIVLNVINPDITNLRDSSLRNIIDPNPTFGFGDLDAPLDAPKDDFDFGACIASGKSETECMGECIATGRSAGQCASTCFVDPAIPDIGCEDAYADTTLRECLNTKSQSECLKKCEADLPTLGDPDTIRKICLNKIAEILGENNDGGLLTQEQYDFLKGVCESASRSSRIVLSEENRFIECGYFDGEDEAARIWCDDYCIPVGGQGITSYNAAPKSCAPEDPQTLPARACGFLNPSVKP